MIKILNILWEASALKNIVDMLNDESGHIISDAGHRYLSEMEELQILLDKARRSLQRNPDSELHQLLVRKIEADILSLANSTTL